MVKDRILVFITHPPFFPNSINQFLMFSIYYENPMIFTILSDV